MYARMCVCTYACHASPGDDGDGAGAGGVDGGGRVFPRAVVSPGILHISHNLLINVDKHMKFWDEFLSGLQAVVTLLHYKDYREAFIERCVKGTAFDSTRSGLNSGLPTTSD